MSWSLRVDVWVSAGDELPEDEAHAFWVAMDKYVDMLSEAGVRVRTLSDAPDWALNYWSDREAPPPADVTAAALTYLTAARRALPRANFKVMLNDADADWSDVRGFIA